MKVLNNYNECLTNLACSIRKYFDLEYKHHTLDYIDKILEEKKPKNVVTILCDGMGSKFLNDYLNKEDFLNKYLYKEITTVFPATTVAATTSMMTGLNPLETAMLGWDMYYKELDKIITTFLNVEKGTEEVLKEAIEYKNKNMITKSIMDEINEVGKYQGYTLFPFGENCYKDRNDMYSIIKSLCAKDGKKYIYAYDTNPDSLMHEFGCGADCVKEVIKEINNHVEVLSKEVNDTIIFVVADHGHINIENLFIENYDEVNKLLKRETSLEPRAVNFSVLEDKLEEFPTVFNKYFQEYFDLYKISEVIEDKLFGDGLENKVFRDILGDYLAIAKSDKALTSYKGEALKSHHAGYTLDEVMVPLIMIDTDSLEKDSN